MEYRNINITFSLLNYMDKISSGSKPIDGLLSGGYECGVISTLFGEAGSGKSNLCMLAALTATGQGRNVIYVDTEGGFSVERAAQLFPRSHEQLLSKIIFFNPTSFEEQRKAFDQITDASEHGRLGLIIVDSIVMLYRLMLGDHEKDVSETNHEMARQLRILSEIARKKNVAVLVTNQVYSSFDNRDEVRMVGGDLLKYWSKCIVKLEKVQNPVCKATIFKHRSLPAEKSTFFEIKEREIVEAKEPKEKFKLF